MSGSVAVDRPYDLSSNGSVSNGVAVPEKRRNRRIKKIGMYCSIEEELWRMFTFYAMHADAAQPEALKPANFLRFCKDAQIISPRLSSSSVELEITRHVRVNKPIGEDYNPSTSLYFSDFIHLLEHLAVKVYVRDTPEEACRRLMLENVLLLANRRLPTNDQYDLGDAEAQKLVLERFSKSLHQIFRYYSDKAEHRRNTAISVEKTKQREYRLSNGLGPDEPLPQSMQQTFLSLKLLAKAQRDTISYKEYLNFCQDFNLKSTSLLTAIQVAEVFFNIVPISASSASTLPVELDVTGTALGSGGGAVVRRETGMSFDLFCHAVIYLALVAHRYIDGGNSPAAVAPPTHYKVKALFLYMFKTINDTKRTMRLLNNDRTSGVVSGNLNIFGSGHFCSTFQSMWQSDGFHDYTKPDQQAVLSGTKMLRKAIGESLELESQVRMNSAQEGAEESDQISALGTSCTPRSVGTPSRAPRLGTATQGADTPRKSGQSIAESLRQHLSLPPEFGTIGYTSEEGDECIGGVLDQPFRPEFSVNISSDDLHVLFSKRPELTEFLFLEIENMRIQTARLTSKTGVQQQLHKEHT